MSVGPGSGWNGNGRGGNASGRPTFAAVLRQRWRSVRNKARAFTRRYYVLSVLALFAGIIGTLHLGRTLALAYLARSGS
jgi:hypothetical protein